MASPLWVAFAVLLDIQDRGFHEIQCFLFFNHRPERDGLF